MSFLSKIFGTKDAEEKKPAARVRIQFDNAGPWIESEASVFLDPVRQSISASFEGMNSALRELDGKILLLEKAETEEEIEARVKGLAFDNRNALVKKLRAFKSKLEFPDAKNIQESSKFHGEFGAGLNMLVFDASKNIHFTGMFFPDEMKQINAILRKLTIISSESQKTLHENKEKTELFFRANEKIREISGFMNLQKTESEKLKEAKAAMKKLDEEEKKTRKELYELNESDELASMKLIMEQRKNLDGESAVIEGRILQIFSPAAKALKKYERYSAGLDKNERKMLGLYIESPFRAVLADNDLKILKKILENTEMLIGQGRIDLKGSQKEKTLNQLALLKDGGGISKAIAEYEEIKKKSGELEEKERGMDINKKIRVLDEALASLEKRIGEEKEKYSKLENNIENAKQNISRNIKELEPMLNMISGKDVSIEFMP